MSHETFDPITRNIRAIETESRVAISRADNAIVSMRRKRGSVTVADYKDSINAIGKCLEAVNQAHDSVVAHAHLVADNIATRSKNNVLSIRSSLLETANNMLSRAKIENNYPDKVYNPRNALSNIGTALSKSGLLNEAPTIEAFYMDDNQIAWTATYKLPQYILSLLVTINSSSSLVKLGEAADVVKVSIWEDRIPPIWDMSFHYANSIEILNKNVGRGTAQTDNAIIGYVANVMGKDAHINTTNNPVVPDTKENIQSEYDSTFTVDAKPGSAQYEHRSLDSIFSNAIKNVYTGEQGQLVLQLNPATITKTTMARYIASLIQQQTKEPLAYDIVDTEDGYCIRYNSAQFMSITVLGIIKDSLT